MWKPNDGSVIVVEDVLVARSSDFGWHVEIQDRPVFLTTRQIAPGCPMPPDGERGPITLMAVAADDSMRTVYDGASELRRRRHG